MTGESVPTAMLPYCGRSLLSGIIRDLQVTCDLLHQLLGFVNLVPSCADHALLRCLQAREYLYYKVYGTQEITPVAIMTSAAKGNHQRVQKLLAENSWFGRGKESFRHAPKPLPYKSLSESN